MRVSNVVERPSILLYTRATIDMQAGAERSVSGAEADEGEGLGGRRRKGWLNGRGKRGG